jgi:TRAP-type uncharacterized transport system substrate-binding protein
VKHASREALMRWFRLGAGFTRVLAMILIALPGFAAVALAQVKPQPMVSIYTDGIVRPDGRVTRALTELVRMIDNRKEVRPLPVMGYGGVANIHDLLHSRGVEFAVVNNDILTYLDLVKKHPDARPKIRYVTKLFSQKVYLLVRADIAALDQLNGKTVAAVGPESSTEATAKVIFSNLRVQPEIRRYGAEGLTDDGIAALLVLENDRGALPAGLAGSGGFRLLAIPANEKLRPIYRKAVATAGEIPGVAGDGEVETVAVDTLLAVYDWAPAHIRYPDVSRFIERFFAALPKLRQDYPDSIWNETDVHASVGGWKRYHHAEKAKAGVPPVPPVSATAKPTPTALRSAAQPVAGAPATPAAGEGKLVSNTPFETETIVEQAEPPEVGTPQSQSGLGAAFRLSAVAAPPLTDKFALDGGLIAELAMAVMKRATEEPVALTWSKDKARQIEEIAASGGASAAIPWETPDCEEPQFLASQNAVLCDGALISAPLFQVPVVYFTKADSNFRLDDEAGAIGRVLCLPAERDLTDLPARLRNGVETKAITLRRPATLIDCLSMVERGEAEALIASEAETRFAIGRLGLAASFKMADTPLMTRGIHIAIPKLQPGAEALLEKVNASIAEFKKSADYGAIVAKHLPSLMAGTLAKTE